MAFNLNTYEGLKTLVTEAYATNNNYKKGQTFENLCVYLFENMDGVIVDGQDVQMDAEEIDIVLWNAKVEEVLRPFDDVFIVECKNWSQPAGATQLDSFLSKLRRRKMPTGIFIAANGVTGDFLNSNNGVGAIELIKIALSEGIRCIVLNKEDLFGITSIDGFRTLIRKRYVGLFVHRIFNE